VVLTCRVHSSNLGHSGRTGNWIWNGNVLVPGGNVKLFGEKGTSGDGKIFCERLKS
jgi:hypothetical protein